MRLTTLAQQQATSDEFPGRDCLDKYLAQMRWDAVASGCKGEGEYAGAVGSLAKEVFLGLDLSMVRPPPGLEHERPALSGPFGVAETPERATCGLPCSPAAPWALRPRPTLRGPGRRAPQPRCQQRVNSSTAMAAPGLERVHQAPFTVPAVADTLRTHVTEVQSKDSRCVLVVRKIQRLGHDSNKQLRAYFEWFGPVESVLTSPVRSQAQEGGMRLRPAHLGFVVMAAPEDARAALSDGESQNVAGVQIEVQQFVPHCHGSAWATEQQ